MPHPSRLTRRLVVALALVVPSVAAAQAPASTGVNVNSSGQDTRWDVQVTNSGGTSAFFDALLVTSPPGAWRANTAGSAWISAASNGSVGLASTYAYQMTFTVGGLPSATSLSFQCAVDNFFEGYYLNGVLMSTTGCGQQASYNFTGVRTLTSGFVAGQNVLEFRSRGDGTTDGLNVEITAFSSQVSNVPEPATLALTATGLLGVLALARQRQRA